MADSFFLPKVTLQNSHPSFDASQMNHFSCYPLIVQSVPSAVPLNVLLVGFPEPELAFSYRSVFNAMDPQPFLEQCPTIQESLAQISLGKKYDVIVLDCGRAENKWEQARHIPSNGKETVILGIMGDSKTESRQGDLSEDGIGWLVDEAMAPTVLKWLLNHAQERKQFLNEQEHLQNKLGDAAYKIEMADVASTVLHNVGNVLTSVTVAATMIESVVDRSSVTLVNRMAELLKTHSEDLGNYLTEDPKGKRIPPSLEKLGAHLIQEQQTVLNEMKGLVRNIRHMKQIIASHQTMAKSAGAIESVALVDVLSHAMELSFQPGDTNWISIRRDYQDVPTVLVDQHQLLQVLVNILRNAKQAMRQQAQESHELHLRVTYQDDEKTRVLMTIQDSGIGIAPEHLSKMFTRGFTTKDDGNGIGLHSSVRAIQNMGGSMHVNSDGVGKGAIFTLIFPIQPPVVGS